MTGTQNLENEVWSQEVAYGDSLKAADLANFISFWHGDGMGWPIQPSPLSKDAISQMIAEALPALESLTSELRPMSVRVYNNSVGITHYESHMRITTKDGAEIVSHTKVTHTWLRTEHGWKIIGGMEAPLVQP